MTKEQLELLLELIDLAARTGYVFGNDNHINSVIDNLRASVHEVRG